MLDLHPHGICVMKNFTKIPFTVLFFSIVVCFPFIACDGSLEDSYVGLAEWRQDVIVQNRTDTEIVITNIDAVYGKLSLPKSISSGKDASFWVKFHGASQTYHWTLTISCADTEYSHTATCSTAIDFDTDGDDDDDDMVICIDIDENDSIRFTEN